MTIEPSYSAARQNLAALLDRVTDDREIVLIRRRRGDGVAMVAAEELASLLETAHLLRSPRNAERLLRALRRAMAGQGRPQGVARLRRDLGLDRKR